MLEVLVAAFIMAMVMVNLAGIFIAGKRLILHTRSRRTGGELGKYFLDPLQMQVRQDEWNKTGENANCLGASRNCPNRTAGTAEGLDRDYTATYDVSLDNPITNLNKVKVTITWNEPGQ